MKQVVRVAFILALALGSSSNITNAAAPNNFASALVRAAVIKAVVETPSNAPTEGVVWLRPFVVFVSAVPAANNPALTVKLGRVKDHSGMMVAEVHVLMQGDEVLDIRLVDSNHPAWSHVVNSGATEGNSGDSM